MSLAYSIKDQYGLHLVTFTVPQWADVFTKWDYANIVIGSLKFCQKEKRFALPPISILLLPTSAKKYSVTINKNCRYF